jgi:hypothetical protein
MERDSLDAHLGAMSSEELMQKADALRSLQEHPGWAIVTELIDVQREKSVHQMVHRPMREAAAYSHIAGYVKALEQVPRIIEKALDTARRVREALEGETDAGESG